MSAYKKIWIIAVFLLVLALCDGDAPLVALAHTDSGSINEVQVALKDIFTGRAQVLINQNSRLLNHYYLTDQAAGRNAVQNEQRRTRYVNAWASKRSIKLVKAHSDFRIIRTNVQGDTAKVSVVQSLKISYAYINKTIPEQSFGIGTRHFMTLKRTRGSWMIAKEWYLDPLDENPDKIAESPGGQAPSVKPEPLASGKTRYNRARAVAYADKYAGAAWGAGNRHRYNRKYLDYTGKGGDCTNFSSQVLGDIDEGGGLAMRAGWRYFYGSGGTQTWVQTDAFRNFLLYSGYGTMVAKGTFSEIVTPTSRYPLGAASKLQIGDLVGYILKHNDTDHFSVITGFDLGGYPLVNSHTADRYRVPFDLGWDEHTKYELIHIRD